ncbi:hypothetical protein SCHPADRAFT_904641 [Schizopora paradoxa]|uniref:Uncharacterized protein n=1 Tax=Schizopora paradoxa TaxID=27342 RepID=A0A0H2RM33_9AGAM|nr:hypothetical protein SCHPADRAFT_904641 [Schizopora paradoxa]
MSATSARVFLGFGLHISILTRRWADPRAVDEVRSKGKDEVATFTESTPFDPHLERIKMARQPRRSIRGPSPRRS